MTINNIGLYQQALSPPTLIEGKVAGVALPFNMSSKVSGIHFDEETGKVTFFAYTIYMPGSLNAQLSSADPLDRTRFMWEHGLQGGVTTIPIGNITSMVATDVEVRFTAALNDTSVAEEMRLALQAESIKEVSVKVESLTFDFPTDSQGSVFQRVTEAFIWDVSLVRNGQYPQTRLTEVFCAECKPGQSPSSRREPHGERQAGDDIPVSIEQVGALYARINDLQEELRLQRAMSLADAATQKEASA